jgi:hypothetical protein
MCRRFGTLFHLHTIVNMNVELSVPRRRHIKFRRREITLKKEYNIYKVHAVAQLVEALCYKPEGAIGIFHDNPSGRTLALGLTQLLTEMSTRNVSLS